MNLNLLLLSAILVQSLPAQAQESSAVLDLTLHDALRMALQKNLEIQIARLEPELLEHDVTTERAILDPVIRGSIEGGRLRSQTATFLDGSPIVKRDDTRVGVSVVQKLKTGGNVEWSLNDARIGTNSQFSAFESVSATSTAVKLTQPILKGRGRDVTLGAYDVALNNYRIGRYQFRDIATSIIAETEQLYWDVAITQKNLEALTLALQSAKELAHLVTQKVTAGVLKKNDLTQAQAGVADREEDIILGQQAVHDAEDRLKAITEMLDEPESRQASIRPVTPLPSIDGSVSSDAAMATALNHRPDYLALRLDLKNRNIQIELARNAKYPQLDLVGSLGLNGITGNRGNSIDSLASGDFHEWSIGLSLDVPWGRTAAKSRLRHRVAEKTRALIELKRLERDIHLDIRGAVRRVASGQKRIQTAEENENLQAEKLKSEQARLREGVSTAQQVLDFQLDFLRAQVRKHRAISDLQKATIDLERLQGTLLESRQLIEGKPIEP